MFKTFNGEEYPNLFIEHAGIFISKENDEISINIDSMLFNTLSKDNLAILLEHEIGHFQLGHLTDKREISSRMEDDADIFVLNTYSIKQYSQALLSLSSFMRTKYVKDILLSLILDKSKMGPVDYFINKIVLWHVFKRDIKRMFNKRIKRLYVLKYNSEYNV
jgi:hypothetical protein